MERQKIYGYMRVSTREQNEERQRIALLEMGVPEKQICFESECCIKCILDDIIKSVSKK